jgi:hypothetical protein
VACGSKKLPSPALEHTKVKKDTTEEDAKLFTFSYSTFQPAEKKPLKT